MVITIIAVLVGISYAVLADTLVKAKIEATRATIRQLDSALQERIEAFHRVNLRTQAARFKYNYDNAGTTNTPAICPLELAEIMVRKDRFRAAFPQREEDLWGLNGVEDLVDDSPLLVQMWDPAASAWRPDSWRARNPSSNAALGPLAESSELLYVALTQGTVFGLPSLGIDNINRNHIGDTDGDGNLEFLDEWGHPLRFYNWTTRLIRPAGYGTDITAGYFQATTGVLMPDVIPPYSSTLSYGLYSHPLNQDPDDQTGAMAAAQFTPNSPPGTNPYVGILTAAAGPWYYGSSGTIQPFDESFYHTPDTFHVPLIVSGGPDEDLGMFEPDGFDSRTGSTMSAAYRLGRAFAEDVNWNGTLDSGEDLQDTDGDGVPDGDGNLDTADALYDNLTNRQR